MDLSASVLGRAAVNYLQDRQRTAVLRIGADTFDRATLAGVACFSFTAAANLSKILNAELQVKNTRDVFDRITPAQLALPRLGAVSLAVLGAAFEAKRIGGATPLASWVAKHRDGKLITFGALKHQHDQQPTPARRPRVSTKRRK